MPDANKTLTENSPDRKFKFLENTGFWKFPIDIPLGSESKLGGKRAGMRGEFVLSQVGVQRLTDDYRQLV